MARYRDSRTGKFVSKTTWTRSRTRGGSRYKRIAAAPSRKTTGGKRRGTPRKQQPTPAVVTHMIQVDIRNRKGEKYGSRDLLVPAPRGAGILTLRDIASKTLPPSARPLAQFIVRGVKIIEGPVTKSKYSQVR